MPTVPKHLAAEPRLGVAYREGFSDCRRKVLEHLEQKWLEPGAPERDSAEAKFFLEAVRQISEVMD